MKFEEEYKVFINLTEEQQQQIFGSIAEQRAINSIVGIANFSQKVKIALKDLNPTLTRVDLEKFATDNGYIISEYKINHLGGIDGRGGKTEIKEGLFVNCQALRIGAAMDMNRIKNEMGTTEDVSKLFKATRIIYADEGEGTVADFFQANAENNCDRL